MRYEFVEIWTCPRASKKLGKRKMYPDKLWIETPLIRSNHISSILGCDAYLKLETFQPPQSFKARGVSHFAQHAFRTYGPDAHLIIASSGNAGIAAAWAAKVLKLRCTVFLPHGVNQSVIDYMREEGAEVIVGGTCYPEALQLAQAAVKADAKAVMVPSYNHPLLWEGHASLVHEIKDQLPGDTKPDALFCSVGGGGLAGGIMQGCKDVGWDDVCLVTMETHGSNCFYQSLSLNEGPLGGDAKSRPVAEGTKAVFCDKQNVTVAYLPELSSRATSLGASSPAAEVVKTALRRAGGTKSVCVPDEMAMQVAVRFAEEHKLLTELACSVTLVPAYKPTLFRTLITKSDKPLTVVFVLCGGVKVSLKEMEEYKNIVNAEMSSRKFWDVTFNGASYAVSVEE